LISNDFRFIGCIALIIAGIYVGRLKGHKDKNGKELRFDFRNELSIC
jgi:hypothetical protein